MNWGVPMETLLASSLEDIRPCKTLVVDYKDNINKRINIGNDSIADCFRTISASEIDPYYFPIDTINSYQTLSNVP